MDRAAPNPPQTLLRPANRAVRRHAHAARPTVAVLAADSGARGGAWSSGNFADGGGGGGRGAGCVRTCVCSSRTVQRSTPAGFEHLRCSEPVRSSHLSVLARAFPPAPHLPVFTARSSVISLSFCKLVSSTTNMLYCGGAQLDSAVPAMVAQ
eukprot:365969-Chlamydomonas_euryale.AAC.2